MATEKGNEMDPVSLGVLVGASTIGGIAERKQAEEEARKKAIMEALQFQSQTAGKTGDNQQNVLKDMMAAYRTAYMGG